MSRNGQARWLGCFCIAELEKMEEDCTHYAMMLNYVKNSLYKKNIPAYISETAEEQAECFDHKSCEWRLSAPDFVLGNMLND